MKNKLLVISILLIIIIVVSYYWYNKYKSYSETYVNTTTNIYIYNIDYSKPEQPINKIVLQLQIPEDFMGFLFIGCPPDPRLCSIRKMINLYRQLNIPVYRIKGWIIPEYEILLKLMKWKYTKEKQR